MEIIGVNTGISRNGLASLDLSRLKPANTDDWRDAFREFHTGEVGQLVSNLFSILPERGCSQMCPGCHAAALRQISTSDWETIVRALSFLRQASAATGTEVQGNRPQQQRLVETFRDGDPAQYRFIEGRASLDGRSPVARGIGDFAEEIYTQLGTRVKVMTSGLWQEGLLGARNTPASVAAMSEAEHREQLRRAAHVAGRVSVSVSIQTMQHRRLGIEKNALVLADTLQTVLEGAPASTPVYLDMMYFSPDGKDPDTLQTKDLLYRVVQSIEPGVIADRTKHEISLAILDPCSEMSGSTNTTLLFEGTNLGLRISPYLQVGRAVKGGKGHNLGAVSISNELEILPGSPSDCIWIDAGADVFSATRAELMHGNRMPELIDVLRRTRERGFLAEEARLGGPWLSFFRAEIDLTPQLKLSPNAAALAPGANLPVGVNIILSDFESGELQLVVPFKRLHL